MAHHKRKKPKHQRAGCLMCKPYKDERTKGSKNTEKPSVRRKLQEDDKDVEHLNTEEMLKDSNEDF